MGYLTNKYVKDEKKKFWIQTAIDVFLIIMLIVVGLSAKAEFENGARFMLQNVPAYCMNYTLYHQTLEYYDLQDSETSPQLEITGNWSP